MGTDNQDAVLDMHRYSGEQGHALQCVLWILFLCGPMQPNALSLALQIRCRVSQLPTVFSSDPREKLNERPIVDIQRSRQRRCPLPFRSEPTDRVPRSVTLRVHIQPFSSTDVHLVLARQAHPSFADLDMCDSRPNRHLVLRAFMPHLARRSEDPQFAVR